MKSKHPIYIGKKRKGRSMSRTIKYADKEVTNESLKQLYSEKALTRKTVESKLSGFYDPMGFASPLKTLEEQFCRKTGRQPIKLQMLYLSIYQKNFVIWKAKCII